MNDVDVSGTTPRRTGSGGRRDSARVADAAPESTGDAPSAICTVVEDVMGVLGRAWAGAVLEAMLDGCTRFRDIARAVPDVTDGVLSTRLKEFCARGLAERIVDPGPPTAVRYRLTDAGRDVAPVLAAVREFGAAHPEVTARP